MRRTDLASSDAGGASAERKRTRLCFRLAPDFVRGFLAVAFVLLLPACRSSKDMTPAGRGNEGNVVERVDRTAWPGLKEGTVTSKMDLDLTLGRKNLSAGGSCNLKRDEIIQLSLVFMGFMEVGCIEFTPRYMMMINRMGREYVKVDYADVPYLQEAGVDFYTLQALFWNDVFVPGKEGRWQEQDFAVSKDGESTVLTSKDGSLLQCRFVVDLLTGLIRNTSVAVTGRPSAPRLDWTYRHFADVGQKSFPDEMQLSVTGGKEKMTVAFSLRHLKWNEKDIEPTPEPGGKYKRVSPDLILKQLVK